MRGGRGLTFVGLLMMTVAAGLTFSMVIRLVLPSLLLSFSAYGLSFVGLTLALAGIAKGVILRSGL